MGKKESHKQDLANFFDEFLETADDGQITDYLIRNSNLPGPRVNLELGEAFTEIVEQYFVREPEILWNLCQKLIKVSSDETPTNDPKEFLPFCAAWSVSSVGSVPSAYFQKTLNCLQELAKGPRWRMREAVAIRRIQNTEKNAGVFPKRCCLCNSGGRL